MQLGPSLHPESNRVSGVWPLRIPISSVLGLRWFIVWAISAISISPAVVRCRPERQISSDRPNASKSSRLRTQRITPKKRDDHIEQIIPGLNPVAVEVLLVVVVPPVDGDG